MGMKMRFVAIEDASKIWERLHSNLGREKKKYVSDGCDVICSTSKVDGLFDQWKVTLNACMLVWKLN